MRIWILFFILFYSLSSQAYRPIDKVINILNECRWNSKATDITTDCNDLFHHYLPAENKYKPGKDVRLGSYNIFRLSEQKFKRLDITAEMIDQSWDIVALSEVQPNRASDLEFNLNALIALEKGAISEKDFKAIYDKPRYLLLLEELQKRDKSWGLVVSPFSQGTDSELFGFFYRANKAQIEESQYCKNKYTDNPKYKKLNVYREYRSTGNPDDGAVSPTKGVEAYTRDFVKPQKAYACTLALDGLGLKRFSKIPLTARFKSGKFDFSYITLHLRFRADDTVLNKCKEKCKATAAKMLENLNLPSKIFKEIAGNKQGKNITNGDAREIARFFEAATALREAVIIKNDEKDQDVIVAGDYNLNYETEGKWAPLWDALLKIQKDSEVLIEGKTSVSNKEGLSNNYDHFVLVSKEGATDECDTSTAEALNFLSPDFVLADELSKYLDADNFDKIAEEHREKLLAIRKVDKRGNIISYQDIVESGKMPSSLAANYKICRIDNDNYEISCKKPNGLQSQVIRKNDELEYCHEGRWYTQDELESSNDSELSKIIIKKVKVPKMAQEKLNPVDGGLNNIFCQVFYQNDNLPKSIVENLHPRHKTRLNFDGKPLVSGAIPKADVYKPYTALMSDHVPISLTCSTKKGD